MGVLEVIAIFRTTLLKYKPLFIEYENFIESVEVPLRFYDKHSVSMLCQLTRSMPGAMQNS